MCFEKKRENKNIKLGTRGYRRRVGNISYLRFFYRGKIDFLTNFSEIFPNGNSHANLKMHNPEREKFPKLFSL